VDQRVVVDIGQVLGVREPAAQPSQDDGTDLLEERRGGGALPALRASHTLRPIAAAPTRGIIIPRRHHTVLPPSGYQGIRDTGSGRLALTDPGRVVVRGTDAGPCRRPVLGRPRFMRSSDRSCPPNGARGAAVRACWASMGGS